MRLATKRCNEAPPVRAAPSGWLVIVMAKAPEMGRVKTRLGREIGPAHATRFYRSTAGAVHMRICRDTRFKTMIAVTPDTARTSPMLPSSTMRVAQGRGDLGVRMQRLANRAPADRVVIVGTDVPLITSARLIAAFKALGRSRIVFGPADDGGFWLVGFKKAMPTLRPFAKVRWSSADTLADVTANLNRSDFDLVQTLSDVDTATDLRRMSRSIGRVVLPSG
jgi:rSAM/selenodomain-associated transferase 1